MTFQGMEDLAIRWLLGSGDEMAAGLDDEVRAALVPRNAGQVSRKEGSAMKKTLGLLALTVGLAAGGCAMLPHGPVAPIPSSSAQNLWSGPVTLHLNIPQSLRTTQGLRSGAKMVDAYVLTATGDVGVVRNGSEIEATTSVNGTGASAIVSLPALPADGHSYFLVINAYNTLTPAAIGTASIDDASNSIVAQTEIEIHPTAGLPVTNTLTMFNCIAPSANLDAPASYSSAISGITAPTTGLPLRWFAWPFTDLATGTAGGSEGSAVIMTIDGGKTGAWSTVPTDATKASASFGAWDDASVSYLATASALSGVGGVSINPTWSLDSTKRYLYATYAMPSAAFNASASYGTNGSVGYNPNFSVVLPSDMLPTGYMVYLTDANYPVGLPGNGTL